MDSWGKKKKLFGQRSSCTAVRYQRKETHGDVRRSSSLSCFSVVFAEQYRNWPPSTSALDITAVTRCFTPAGRSKSSEPVWVAIGRYKRLAARFLGPFCLRHWHLIDSIGKFSSTTEYRITLKVLVPSGVSSVVLPNFVRTTDEFRQL
jgi:hypothetical protein